jgi:putative membrane protein
MCWLACDIQEDDDTRPSLNDADENFVERVALSNIAEIKLAELVVTKTNDSLVTDFAQHMITEHSTIQTELRNIANVFNDVDWPEVMDHQHKALYGQLNALQGYSFDSLYMRSQINDHQVTLSIFQTELSTGTVDRVKSFADKYRPHIEAHFNIADSIENVITSQAVEATSNGSN